MFLKKCRYPSPIDRVYCHRKHKESRFPLQQPYGVDHKQRLVYLLALELFTKHRKPFFDESKIEVVIFEGIILAPIIFNH